MVKGVGLEVGLVAGLGRLELGGGLEWIMVVRVCPFQYLLCTSFVWNSGNYHLLPSLCMCTCIRICISIIQ